MNPVNIPSMLDLAREAARTRPSDEPFPVLCSRIHARLGYAYDGWSPVDRHDVYAAMGEILILCASRGWHLGIAMAEEGLPERVRDQAGSIAETHAAIGLAFAADLVEPENKVAPLSFLAIAFHLLLDLCLSSGFEPAEGLDTYLRVSPL